MRPGPSRRLAAAWTAITEPMGSVLIVDDIAGNVRLSVASRAHGTLYERPEVGRALQSFTPLRPISSDEVMMPNSMVPACRVNQGDPRPV